MSIKPGELQASLVAHQSISQRAYSYPTWLVVLGWAIFLAFVYRQALLDTHEKSWLLFACSLAQTIKLSIVNNFEYVIYRATLARYEFIRLKVDLVNFKKMLVFIEDRGFFSHHGISIKALVRALLGLIKVKRRSGGSTISQQLGRTLFIVDQSKLVRRKIVEILFALWIDCIFSKDEQLELYLASVRFERGVYGAIEAMHHYWGRKISKPSKAEAFFLIERVSNIYSLFHTDKIIQIARLALDAGLMNSEDIKELVGLYRDSILLGKILDPNGGIDRMSTVFDTVQ